jgi:hypothetical protein
LLSVDNNLSYTNLLPDDNDDILEKDARLLPLTDDRPLFCR